MARKYFDHPLRNELDSDYYKIYDRSIKTEIKLFRQKNIEPEKQNSQLSQKYQKITGAMTVTWEGEEKTLPQMRIFLQNTDRKIRENAWRTVTIDLSK